MPSKRELFLDRAIRIPWFREERMRELTVTVVGIGNIGSQLVIALCSLGIGRAYLLDKDIVEYTNLQRQIVYGKEDIGRPKADAAADFVKKRFEDLDIDVRGIACDIRFSDLPESDYVFCCVDSNEARKAVLKQCLERDIPLVDTGLEFSESQAGHVILVDSKMFPEGACVNCYMDLSKQSASKGCIAAGITYSGGIIANVAAGMFVQHVHGKLKANYFFIDLNSCTAEFMFLRKSEGCGICSEL